MKVIALLRIETGREECVDVNAYSKEDSNIFIDADSLERALALFPTGIEKAEGAMRAWTPETAPPPPVPKEKGEHHRVLKDSDEKMEREAKAYEATRKGQRFMKSIDKAREFEDKYCSNSCLYYDNMIYLSNKHKGSLLNGMFDVYCLAYRDGFRDGRKKTGGA